MYLNCLEKRIIYNQKMCMGSYYQNKVWDQWKLNEKQPGLFLFIGFPTLCFFIVCVMLLYRQNKPSAHHK